jgi:Zn-dependent protease
MFYKIDSSRITLREYSWGTPFLLLPLAWLSKVLRIQLPASTDDPNVDSLVPFQVSADDLPDEVRAKFAPLEWDLTQCGFQRPVYHAVIDTENASKNYFCTTLHPSGQALARLHYRVWTFTKTPREFLFPTFITSYQDGTFLVSSAGKPDMLAPPSCRIHRHVGAEVGDLWRGHQQQMQQDLLTKAVIPIRDQEELRSALERHHAAVRDFHLARGVFVPPTPAQLRPRPVTSAAASGVAIEATAVDAAEAECLSVIAEIDRMGRGKPGWGNAVLILVVSLVLFIGLGTAAWSWQLALLLIPILLVHELGHLLAMRIFKYRNLRMFFIPLFGAAVTGRNYNVPGWKKAVVSLMGPLPGIALAIPLGIAALVLDQEQLLQAALLTLVLNGFNLLPLLPLDGGWVMHALFFSRHPLLDTGFRLAACLLFITGGVFAGFRFLMFIGILMLIGLPTSYRMARIVAHLRRRGLSTESPDGRAVPMETARVVIDEIKSAFTAGLDNRRTAQLTVQVFESLNARPPGWLATIGLSGVHAAALLAAVVFTMLLIIGRHAW